MLHKQLDSEVVVKVAQSCTTLCDSMDCSLPGSSIHRILQARILEWVAIPFPRGSSQPRDQTQVSPIAGRFFIVWATREAQTKYFKCVTPHLILYKPLNYYYLKYIFIYFWLCWLFVAVHRFFSTCGDRELKCSGFLFGGFPCCRAQALGVQAY